MSEDKGRRYYYAHSLPESSDVSEWQLLSEHLENTAKLAKNFASTFDAERWGYIAGLWHDIGKYSEEFQRKLEESSKADTENKKKIEHAIFGAKIAAEKWPKGEGKLLAYIIAGHHSGLPDGLSNEYSCLCKRLQRELHYKVNYPKNLLEQHKPELPFRNNCKRLAFQISFFTRMLYSALVDADFLDTEKFYDPQRFSQRGKYLSLTDIDKLLSKRLNELQNEGDNSEINMIRKEVNKFCLLAANDNPGLFSLTVPTGGGKTLSSLAFSVKHAIKYNKKRIIYVIPFTSIIEQNANVFRKIVGESVILEHHCNFESADEDYFTRLASENWDAPIVVTTNVQFFESLFANRPGRCRKLHNIANSVIILDEVQCLPDNLLLPCIETLRELSLHYKCSIVLCSATQPAIQLRDDFKAGLENVREIIANPDELAKKLKRVRINILDKQTDEQLIARFEKYEQFLCIVNTRKHAHMLYEKLKSVCSENVFHLSTLMYPVHRSKVLSHIRKLLRKGKPCRVISTQLVEAGVDIDFPVVFRSIAGLDSIAQAAGRCNREGKRQTGDVYVFYPEEGLPAGYFRQTAQTAESIFRRFPDDVLSLEAIEEYFKDYYWQKGEKKLDKEGILSLIKRGVSTCDFPFKEIAQKFQLIKQTGKPVIIAIENEAKELINEIRDAYILRGYSRKLQKYTVQIPQSYWDNLADAGHIDIVREIFPVLVFDKMYDEHTGLNIYDIDNPEPEDLIC